MANNSANPFAWFGRMSKQNPKWAQDVNNLSGFTNTMGYMDAGQKALKGDIGGALASGADTYLRTAVPAYGAIKTFNDITGGINFNRMMNPRKPVYDESKLAAQAMNANMIESQRNLASQQMRDAMEQRQQIRPQYEKVQSDLLDMLQQGLSSRQLAPIYGAGEARNRQIGAASQAAMQQNLATRGVGGGIQAGVEQANLAAQNERSAALNNAITQQQLQQRPEMLQAAFNILANRDAQAAAELQAGQSMNLQASQMALNQANLERQQRMQEDAIARANRQQEMENIGSVLALLSPELDRMKRRGQKTGTTDVMPTDTPSSNQIAAEILADEKAQYDALLSNAPIVGRSGNIFQDARDLAALERSIGDGSAPLGDAFNVPAVLRGTFGLAQPENVAGQMMRVTDIATIDEIEASRPKRIMKDVGNGLAILAYKDPSTGQYFKQYVRANPALLGQPMSGDAILRQGETGKLGGTTLARSFYG